MKDYPHFIQALRALAPTNAARAKLLGVSLRTIINYQQGETIPRIRMLKRFPELDAALTLDLEAAETPTELVQETA